ncbi:SPFH domain-containing protein [Luteococcus peritonei]|uniref:SPFH domain-containing protein n=1 Tax=Luteococcus peritonei TaxID=88874 RepID=A0ABW4RRK2_9ACTN
MKKNLWTVDVDAREQVLVHRHGRLVEVFGPGRHRLRRGMRLTPVETGRQVLALAPQEVPCADAMTVRATVAVRWHVADARAWVETAPEPLDELYLQVQVALRDLAVAQGVEQVAGVLRSPTTAATLREAVAPAVADLGIAVDEVVVKDIVLPSELRLAAQRVVVARHEGLARLEAARAETAALRSLANGAKLLDDHPALARLRLAEASTGGTTLVLQEAAPGIG